MHGTFICSVWGGVLGLEVQCLSYVHSAKKKNSFRNWPSHRGWSSHEIPAWCVEVCWVYFLLLINVGTLNNIRVGWVWGEMNVSEITCLLFSCQKHRPREGKDLPKSHSNTETFAFWKRSLTMSGLSFPFCPHHGRLGRLGGIWWGGQAARGTWLWNVLGKQDAFSSRPVCGQKGLWLSAVHLCFVWSVNSTNKVPETCEAW